MTKLICDRCGHVQDEPAELPIDVGFEKLASGRGTVLDLCGECASTLKSWVRAPTRLTQ